MIGSGTQYFPQFSLHVVVTIRNLTRSDMSALPQTGFCCVVGGGVSSVGGPWEPSLLVWSMGKVASSSIYETIRACGVPAIHIHTLNNWDLAQEIHSSSPFHEPPDNIRMSLRFRHGLSCQAFTFPISIVTLVRDPVARNISAFFENLAAYSRLETLDPEKSDALVQEFFDTYSHDVPALWFDREIRELTHLDVLDAGAAADETGLTYHNDRYRLLILKVGDSDEKMVDALETFVNRPVPALLRANEASNKDYAALYAAFRNSISFPESYLDAMYNSDFVRRFWSDVEVEAMKRQWKVSSRFTYTPKVIERAAWVPPVTVEQAFDETTWKFLVSSGGVREADIEQLLAALGPIHTSPALFTDLKTFWDRGGEATNCASSALKIQFTLEQPIDRAVIGVPLFSSRGVLVSGFRIDRDDQGRRLEAGRHSLTLHLSNQPFSAGCYIPMLSIRDVDRDAFIFRKPMLPLFVGQIGDSRSWGIVDVESRWTHALVGPDSPKLNINRPRMIPPSNEDDERTR